MPILFFTEGESEFGTSLSCNESPRKFKPITIEELKTLSKAFQTRTQQSDLPSDLKNKLLIGGRFPLKEVEMLIKQNPDAEYLQVNYAVDQTGKHFHYMIATKAAKKIDVNENTLIIEDCCRIPPNPNELADFF